MKKVKNWLLKEWSETQLLLKSVPAVVVTLFTVAVIAMNLAANKTLVSIGNWFALDGGILVSWLSFMCMDIVTKHFGPKAATKISILAMFINLLTCLIFWVVSVVPNPGFEAIDSVLGGTWFILLSSSVAFLISAVINILINWGLGKMFKKNPDGKVAYVVRTYISTAVGQFLDNLIFALLAFTVFAPVYWGFSWTALMCVTCSLTGALAELIMEVIFSPIGYRICNRWKTDNVGKEYIEAVGIQ